MSTSRRCAPADVAIGTGLAKKISKEGEWIRLTGSDIRKGGMVLAAGKRLLPQDTGLAASVGIKTLPVYGRVRLGRRRGPCQALGGSRGVAADVEIAMKPGRPLALGRVGNAAFIGLPGNPVSSFVTVLIFVRPFILKTQGNATIQPRAIDARSDFDWPEPGTRREFLRVKWNPQGGLDLYPTQDSAVLTSTA